jgi:hypothetical protein
MVDKALSNAFIGIQKIEKFGVEEILKLDTTQFKFFGNNAFPDIFFVLGSARLKLCFLGL